MVRLLRLARSTRNDPEIFAGLVHACRYCGLLEASEAAHREARRLDPHLSTSVAYTWWARENHQAVLAESSETMFPQLRAMSLNAVGRIGEAVEVIRTARDPRLAPVLEQVAQAITAFLEGRPDAAATMRDMVAVHTDPEALHVYGLCQARLGDSEAALETLARAVDAGYCVPRALGNRWLDPLRGPLLDALVARAEYARRQAEQAFQEAGGRALLGV
jgi:tetratricopeptide (TPR) repeat protein